MFVCLFVRLECLFVVVPCATAGPAPVRRQHARKVRWGYSGYSRMGLGGPVPAGYGRTCTGILTPAHTRTRTHAPAYAHPCTRIQAHAQGASVERPADVSGGCLPYKERSVGRNDGTVPYVRSARLRLASAHASSRKGGAGTAVPRHRECRRLLHLVVFRCLTSILRYHESRF